MLVVSESRVFTAILLSPRYGGLDVPAETKSLLAAGFMAAVLKNAPPRVSCLSFQAS